MTDRAMEHEFTLAASSPLPAARRVVVLAPHADDEVFGCGGTVRLLVEAGATIAVIVVTDGALGDTASKSKPDTLITRREAETRAAAKVLGYPEPTFWRMPDRGIRYGEALISKVLEAIRSAHADLVFAPALTELHPDHQALALAAAEALRRLGGAVRIAFYEVGAPLLPNMLIDITAVEELKRRAMRCFDSQQAVQLYGEQVAALNRFRTYTLGHGVHAAEAFFMATAAELADGLAPLFESALGRRRRLGLAIDGTELPLVSVIVRSTGRPLLNETLASVAAQTYPNIEVVVVNMAADGHAALPDFGGRYVLRCLETTAALGGSRAANAGLDAAAGRYILLLDEDDLLLPEHLAKLADALRESGAGAAYSGVRLTQADGGTLWMLDEPWEPVHLLGENFLPAPAVLFDRSLVTAGCRFDESLEAMAEWDFWLQAASHTRFVYVPGISAVSRSVRSVGRGAADVPIETCLTQRSAILAKWRGHFTDKDREKALYWLVRRREQALAHVAAARHDNALLTQQNATLADKNATLAQHNATLTINNATVTQNNATLTRDIAALIQDNAARTQDIAALIQDNAVRTRDIAALLQDNAARTQDITALVQDNAGLTQSNALLAQHNAALAHTNAVLAEQNTGLAAELAGKRQELSAILASTSWWLTAPLRWLVGLLRR